MTKPRVSTWEDEILRSIDHALSELPGVSMDDETGFEGRAGEPDSNVMHGLAENDSSMVPESEPVVESKDPTVSHDPSVTQGSVDKGPNLPPTSPEVKREQCITLKKEKIEKQVKQEPGTQKRERGSN